jgi:hypothetical protein
MMVAGRRVKICQTQEISKSTKRKGARGLFNQPGEQVQMRHA